MAALPKYSSTDSESSFASPSDGISAADTPHDERDDQSRSDFCDNCSRFLLPCSVDAASGMLDEEARQKCTDHLKKLAQEGVQVTLSKTMLECGIEHGCSMCETFQGWGKRLTSKGGTDESPQQSSNFTFLIYTAIHPVSRDLNRATDVGELRLATVPPAPAGLIARFRLFAYDCTCT
jgi:hypothetical protein